MHPPSPVAAEITHRVKHDADQPGAQRLAGTVAGRSLVNLQEDVLEQVIAVVLVDAVAVQETVNEVTVSKQQLLERLLVTSAMAGSQLRSLRSSTPP
jgi:hypothetical protein